MARFLVQAAASHRIDEIYQYTLKQSGAEQADIYVVGLFDAFAKIATHEVLSRPVPAELGVDGFFFRYEKHFVYWRYLSSGNIGIVTILHERMHQIEYLKGAFGLR
jgi:toxin ParE1/3/4